MPTPNGNGAKLAHFVGSALSSVWYAISIIGALVGLVAYTVHLESRITAGERENQAILKRLDGLENVANQALRLESPVGKLVVIMSTKLDAINERELQITARQTERLEEIDRDEKRIDQRLDRMVAVIDGIYDRIRQSPPLNKNEGQR